MSKGEKEYQNEEVLRDLYVEKELNTIEIGEIFGVDDSTIWRWLKNNEIETRPKGGVGPKATAPSLYTNHEGYVEWSVHKGGQVKVHQLLAIADGAEPEKVFNNPKCDIHHKNGVSWDNRTDNIELISTSSHNKEHGAYKNLKSFSNG